MKLLSPAFGETHQAVTQQGGTGGEDDAMREVGGEGVK